MRSNAPAPNITGDVCRVTVLYAGPSGTFQNVLDYMANALNVVTSSVLLALALAVKAQIETQLKACLSQQCIISGYNAAALSLNTPASQFQISGTAGTVAQAPLPDEIGALIRKSSLLKGQHGRGRITVPCVPVTFTTPATDPDVLNATGITAFNSLATALGGNVTASGILFVPVISTRPALPDTVVTKAQVINQFQAETVLGTARRRKKGRGE